jgi:hypothetical protein
MTTAITGKPTRRNLTGLKKWGALQFLRSLNALDTDQSFAYDFRTYKKGVEDFQITLLALDPDKYGRIYGLVANGHFGDRTEIATKALKKDLQAQGLYAGPIDGIVNPPTLIGLNELVSRRLAGESGPVAATANLVGPHGNDPKKLLFVSSDKNDPLVKNGFSQKGDYEPGLETAGVAAMGGRPFVYHLNSAREGVHDPKVIIRTIREHVKKYGTLKELMIDGHGDTNVIGVSAPLVTVLLFSDIKDLERELGIKVVDRIVFGGCRVFAGLDEGMVNIYKDAARELNTEIVGSTTLAHGSPRGVVGHFVQFTPQGTVKEDPILVDRGNALDNYVSDLLFHENRSSDEAWLKKELSPATAQQHRPGHSIITRPQH